MADLKVALEELKEESDSGRLTAGASMPPRKRTWQWAAAGALIALALAGAWLLRRPASAPPETLVPVTRYPGSELYPSFSPDGRQIAFSWDGDKGDNVDIYVKLVGETNARRLTADPAADTFPVWAPDGKRIAFRRAGPHSGIYTVSALGGAEQKLSDFATGYQMSWSPDGKWLADSSDAPPSAIFLLPADGGEPLRVSSPKAPRFDQGCELFTRWAPVGIRKLHRRPYVRRVCRGPDFLCSAWQSPAHHGAKRGHNRADMEPRRKGSDLQRLARFRQSFLPLARGNRPAAPAATPGNRRSTRF
jgi:hypothetical protein